MAARKSILVVDDEPVVLDLIRRCLEDRYDVATAPDGHLALQMLASRSWDLLITDLYMVSLDGIELMQRAKVKGILPLTTMVTASPGHAQEALELGAIAVLPKPFRIGEFQRLVESALES